MSVVVTLNFNLSRKVKRSIRESEEALSRLGLTRLQYLVMIAIDKECPEYYELHKPTIQSLREQSLVRRSEPCELTGAGKAFMECAEEALRIRLHAERSPVPEKHSAKILEMPPVRHVAFA